MTTTAWEIENLERAPATGLVVVVHWTATKYEAGLTASTYGATELSASTDPASPEFKPFNTLTKEDVVQWVHESMGAEYLADVEAYLDARIAAQQTPPVAMGTPW